MSWTRQNNLMVRDTGAHERVHTHAHTQKRGLDSAVANASSNEM